jgi:hypothetical protein
MVIIMPKHRSFPYLGRVFQKMDEIKYWKPREVGKWGNGEMGKWGNGEMGKWGNKK